MQKNNVVKKHKLKRSWDDFLYDTICSLIVIFFVIIVFYPLYFIVLASFSDPNAVNSGEFLLRPKGFNTLGYQEVFKNKDIWIGYGNTLIYVTGSTVLGTFVTVIAGFALSRKDMVGRGWIMKLFLFTNYFGGGTIPLFLACRSYGITETRWAPILLGCCSVYNIIVVRSFMDSNIPEELVDAATIDGCGVGKFFFKIAAPLSKAVIAVIVLYLAVGEWNSYFTAMIMLSDKDMWPLQLYLREILLTASSMASGAQEVINMDPDAAAQLEQSAQVVKYAVIIVSTLPILCMYPFIQKYFVKGVMIGSVKG